MEQQLTPMMQKYLETKEQYKDCILFYRLGDFYEMFFEDALTASKELEITLTGKSCGLEERVPMCGVPFHAVKGYIEKLVNKGYKVAICEQLEDPSSTKNTVKRGVVDVISKGTIADYELLDERNNSYIASLLQFSDICILTICDISTGELKSISIDNNEDSIPFEEKMKNITSELSTQFEESHKLEEEIKKNLKSLGYDI